jgi:ectoine hydroxylase-related dioxygenase (phytanoyl-CoA dioxygenase family)
MATAVQQQTRLQSLPFGAPVEEVMKIIDADGGVILEDMLSPEILAEVNAQLDGPLEELHTGSAHEDQEIKDFHGYLTKRLTNVVTYCPSLQDAVFANPCMLSYVKAMFAGVAESFWLNTCQVIEIHPGEKAQILHRDMGNYPIFFRYGRDAPEVMVNLILALKDVTEEAGATRVIPGSHKWEFTQGFEPDIPTEETIPATLKAGSALFYGGKVIHGGGANITKDVRRRVLAVPYCPGFLVPEEAYPFTVSLEDARKMSPQMQQLIGFRSFHQRELSGGSLWQINYEELADYLKL